MNFRYKSHKLKYFKQVIFQIPSLVSQPNWNIGRKTDIVSTFLDESEESGLFWQQFLYISYFVSCDTTSLSTVESVLEVVNANLGCVLACWNV